MLENRISDAFLGQLWFSIKRYAVSHYYFMILEKWKEGKIVIGGCPIGISSGNHQRVLLSPAHSLRIRVSRLLTQRGS